MLAIPGFIIAALVAFTVVEPRDKAKQQQQQQEQLEQQQEHQRLDVKPSLMSLSLPMRMKTAAGDLISRFAPSTGSTGSSRSSTGRQSSSGAVSSPAVEVLSTSGGTDENGMMSLLRNQSFLATTFAAALNDVGSYALIAWQSTFYER